MPCILHIETSTLACSVAVSLNGGTIYKEEAPDGPSHASLLGVFVDNAVRFTRTNNIRLEAVAVSCGPGSYTGLRIGVSEAKGLCFGLGLPLIALNTLLIMAAKTVKDSSLPEDALLCPMIDARRMEVYAGIYNRQLEPVRGIGADIVDENSYREYLLQHQVVFFGNGADKCKDYLSSENALFLENVYPVASDMVALAEDAFAAGDFVDIAYFEPFYLKEFVATVAKNKGLW
ncbi:tRNA (adenosine(37)-N6)-threonylcarbamoyltransferase complex dimerization subunit type 1 TsaB [Viscerimonas tarda]